jgi:hypothetical protein
VSAYAYWEEYLRIEVGKAMGVLPPTARANEATRKILNKHVVSDFWGDMRYIRNSIVHSNGIANDEVKKCRVLKWFKEATLSNSNMIGCDAYSCSWVDIGMNCMNCRYPSGRFAFRPHRNDG